MHGKYIRISDSRDKPAIFQFLQLVCRTVNGIIFDQPVLFRKIVAMSILRITGYDCLKAAYCVFFCSGYPIELVFAVRSFEEKSFSIDKSNTVNMGNSAITGAIPWA